ncbi:MAG: N-acetylmuramoyl-L-alanine amidase [Proteobacteria bacterium]|nr:N-acetylmuramoyl-L-alanine amidase [Pseudomonadota bacterium]
MRRAMLILAALAAPVALFAAMVAADRHFGAPGQRRPDMLRIELPPPGGLGLPPVEGPLDASRPLVVIDAGHGGHDPGAGGALKEKALTLALARALHDRLLAGGGIRVALTRGDDRYLLLEERGGIARRLKADLFLSIHADAAEGEAAGATLYTLSAKGSSETANRLAARENRADSVNGVALGQTSDAVASILVDLSQRQSAAQSLEFARLILREAAGKMHFRDPPLQSAAFVVLKSPDLPSVLFESGYITNPAEAARLASPAGRAAFAEIVDRAIRVYFARRAMAAGTASASPQPSVPQPAVSSPSKTTGAR